MSKASNWLNRTLGYQFSDSVLLQQALTHRSAPGDNNERLEFLGDAVLDTVISDAVYRACPGCSEGELSRLRSSLVKDSSLAELAADLGIGEFLVLGAGEKKAGGHRRSSILADALEAIFGAVYLDSGYAAAVEVIGRVYEERLRDLPDPADLRDAKTQLQEYLQSKKLALPMYAVIDVSGKAHKQSFAVTCKVDELSLEAPGTGTSRRDAEQNAASNMIKEIGVDK